MVDRGNGHTKATVAVARKLIERTWTVLHRDQPYQLRDTDGTPLTRARAKEIARTHGQARSGGVRGDRSMVMFRR